MSIATKRGDDGTTQLLFGPRVSKACDRVEAYGCLDELGALLGLARSFAGQDQVAVRLEAIQRELFVVGAELATLPAAREKLGQRVTDESVAALDQQVAELEALPGILSDWALPGATQVGSFLDVARTVCRRAERWVVRLMDAGEEEHPQLRAWLNRLGDLLWLYARWYETRVGANGALRPGGRGFA